MIARWGGMCPRCEHRWEPGDAIKPRYVPAGIVDGKMTYRRAEKQYVHMACKPVPKPMVRFDRATGEILG